VKHTGISISSAVITTMQRTNNPGLPVHVEKLKKYRARPMASPGTSEDPENARSALAIRVSKICFVIYKGLPL
jgi:hypothetical protein